ncbi:DUF6470 family protein [Xylanivirga thermophila]|uniref:DUF6470 family protein n=1 Tax=Xylanivirga thermophila TaxID=2496273 RepID=UPI00101DA38F|nr:DUF6470 family protein [Xylanivirga thermophila]
MDIRITQVYGQIGIRTQRAWMDIRQEPPRADISQPKADMDIRVKQPKIHIDQTQCFAEKGLKPALQLAHDYYDECYESGVEAIGDIAEAGDRMMRIEEGRDPIVDLAFESMFKYEGDLNLVCAPTSRPKIELEEGETNIRITPRPADIQWYVHTTADIKATRHKVDIYMERWPDIKVEYVGKKLNKTI